MCRETGCDNSVIQKGCCQAHVNKMCQSTSCKQRAVPSSQFCADHKCSFCNGRASQKGCCPAHVNKLCQAQGCRKTPAWFSCFCADHKSLLSSGLASSSLSMYHGTSAVAAAQIEAHGFRPSTDGMLGRGVYLSQNIAKARHYARNAGVIFECLVDVGRVATIDRQGHPMQKTWHESGYDAAWCPPHCGMVSSGLEEHCIFDPSRIRIVQQVTGWSLYKETCWCEVIRSTLFNFNPQSLVRGCSSQCLEPVTCRVGLFQRDSTRNFVKLQLLMKKVSCCQSRCEQTTSNKTEMFTTGGVVNPNSPSSCGHALGVWSNGLPVYLLALTAFPVNDDRPLLSQTGFLKLLDGLCFGQLVVHVRNLLSGKMGSPTWLPKHFCLDAFPHFPRFLAGWILKGTKLAIPPSSKASLDSGRFGTAACSQSSLDPVLFPLACHRHHPNFEEVLDPFGILPSNLVFCHPNLVPGKLDSYLSAVLRVTTIKLARERITIDKIW